MKRTFYFLCIIIILAVVGCNPDDSETNNTSDIRDKITGGWKCQENSAPFGTQNYIVDIIKDTIAQRVFIDNFSNLGQGKHITAVVSGQTITINNQYIESFLVNGNGSIAANFNSISWNYTIDEGNGPESYTAVYTKM